MEAILKFQLPEEKSEFNFATQGSDWWNVCWEMDQWLRTQYKYMPDEGFNEDKYNTYVEVKNKLMELIHENGVSLDNI
jgi:hypothetical protein